MNLNQDQYNNWGEHILSKSATSGDSFILKGIIEYKYDEYGRNFRNPYSEISEESKKKYIEKVKDTPKEGSN